MDEDSLKSIYYNYIKEICHYSQKQVFATSQQQKTYFQLQIDEAAKSIYNLLKEQRADKQKEITQICTDNNSGGY